MDQVQPEMAVLSLKVERDVLERMREVAKTANRSLSGEVRQALACWADARERDALEERAA